MLSLVSAACFFVGIHVGIAGTKLRDALVARVGEGGFQGLFSLASFVGIIWLSTAYADAPTIPLWGELYALKPVVLVLVLIAFLFVVLGVTTPTPTMTGGDERVLDNEEPAIGILRITRHPFLWGVALWAASHLVVNGEASALVLFGSLLILAVVGPPSIDAKRRRRLGAAYERFLGMTSNVPFAAIVQGRNRLVLGELRPGMLALAVVVYLAALVVHPMMFSVSPLP